jgi:amino acid transporter
MASSSGTSMTPLVHRPAAKLEPNALSMLQDTFIGAALVGPAVSVAISLALLAADTAYGAPLTLILTAIPVIVIANAYRRLNLWNANCGASFEWAGRAVNPYLGFLTGWLMITGTLIGTLTPVVATGPNIMAVLAARRIINGIMPPSGPRWRLPCSSYR